MIRRSLTFQLIVWLCASSPAWAQSPRAGGPFAGLFGGKTGATQTLDFRGSLFAADSWVRVPVDETNSIPLDPRFQKSATFGGASGTLAYAYNRVGNAGAGFFVSGRGSVSDYSINPGLPDASFNTSTGLSARLSRKMQFSTSASASYSPFFRFGSAPEATGLGFDPSFGIPSFSFAAVAQRNITFDGAAGVTASLTKRSTVGVQASWREMHVLDSTANDVLNYGTSVSFNHRLTRTISFRAGYGQFFTRYLGSTAEPTRSQSYDLGLDYGDGFTVPLGRRATLSFGAGAAVVQSRGRARFRMNGDARIGRAIGRTFSVSAAYSRSMQFIAAFVEPVLTDAVSASFGGLLAPRLNWNVGAGISRGQVGFNAVDSFTSYSATSGLTYGLFRSVGLFAQYGYYRYRLPPGSTTLNILSSFGRQTFSVGLSLWVPILNNGRARS